jgi:hypothetical protein
LSYLVIDAIASLVVFFVFKKSATVRARLRFIVRNFLGINDLEFNQYRTNERLDREIRNRQILKKRVDRVRNSGPYR